MFLRLLKVIILCVKVSFVSEKHGTADITHDWRYALLASKICQGDLMFRFAPREQA